MMLDSDFAVKQEQHTDRLARAAQARLVKQIIDSDARTSVWHKARAWLTQTDRRDDSAQRSYWADESA